jgi:carbohydrate-selective porin OprB
LSTRLEEDGGCKRRLNYLAEIAPPFRTGEDALKMAGNNIQGRVHSFIIDLTAISCWESTIVLISSLDKVPVAQG